MSKTDGYTAMVSCAKKLGGTKNFLLFTAGAGIALWECGKKVKKTIRARKAHLKKIDLIYRINSDISGDGVEIKAGSYFAVLEDDEAIDITIIYIFRDQNSPYCIPSSLLHSVSDY